MSQDRQTIAVVDDDAGMLRSLAALLKAYRYEAHAFQSAEAFLEEPHSSRFACLLLDVRMPGMSGLDLQARLNEERINLPIIFMTAHGDIPMAIAAIRAGAIEFIEKPFDDDVLFDAIDRALKADPIQDQMDSLRKKAHEMLARLTARERDVFDRLVLGETNKMIARTLDISQRTVEVHRGNLKEKLNAESLSDLIRLSQASTAA